MCIRDRIKGLKVPGVDAAEIEADTSEIVFEPGPEAVGFAFTPSSTKPLPLGERPCA